jgi:hypothetical protein
MVQKFLTFFETSQLLQDFQTTIPHYIAFFLTKFWQLSGYNVDELELEYWVVEVSKCLH